MKRRTCAFLLIIITLLTLVTMSEAKEIYTGIFGQFAERDWGVVLSTVGESKFKIILGGSSKTLLDEAQKKGVKCIVMLLPSKEIASDDMKWQKYLSDLKNIVTTFKSHPAVFAWMPLDEPDGLNIPVNKIKIIRSVIQSIDKTHPMFTVLTIPSKWSKYLPYFDIVSVDPYLRQDATGLREKPEKVGEYIKKVKRDLRTLKLNKPVWVTLGAFEMIPKVANLQQPYSVGFIKPTPAEFRKMVDISLVNGVDGILVYSLSFLGSNVYKDWDLIKNDPSLWEAVKEIPVKAAK